MNSMFLESYNADFGKSRDTDYCTTCRAYSSILQNSILAVSFTQLMNFSNTLFDGSSYPKFREGNNLINISILQIQNGSGTVVATYNSDLQELLFSHSKLAGDEIPQGRLRTLVNGSSTTEKIVLLIIFVLSFGFISVNLILYFVFRNKPEVKATSVSVSMCMYLGCYLLVLFLPILLLEVQLTVEHSKAYETFICTFLAWLSTIGLPFSLIFATLIVKMLRVYIIFHNPYSYKKKLFSNPALLLYILMILSPIIFTLILMSAIDEFTEVRYVFQMKSHTVAYHGCRNENTIAWLSIIIAAVQHLPHRCSHHFGP